MRDQDGTSTLRVASRPFLLASHVRRAGTVYAHAQSPFIIPDVEMTRPPARVVVLHLVPCKTGRVDSVEPPTLCARGPPIA